MVQTITPADVGGLARGPYATQPWNQVVWPTQAGSSIPRTVWDPTSAMALPSVGRAVGLIKGAFGQMPMDDYRGVHPQPRPRLLDQPDPNESRSWFVGMNVQDYLVHGNAVAYTTAWFADGSPAASVWLPAAWVLMSWDPSSPDYSQPDYWMGGTLLDRSRVTHVKRGADPWWPVRGVGVVEQHMTALDRIGTGERFEAGSLGGNGVPSVAVITPNPRLGDLEADAAKAEWMEKFSGPVRQPAILPAGTQVIPLAWSPEASQLVEVRKQGLQDVANMFNLDGYWLGAPAAGMTYRSPGQQWLQLVRSTLEPIAADFEGVWSDAWLPRGRTVRFDRQVLLKEDLQTTITTLAVAVRAGLMTLAEARVYLGLPVLDDPTTEVDESLLNDPAAVEAALDATTAA